MKGIDSYAGREIIEEPFPGLTLTIEEKEIYDRYWPPIKKLMVENIENWITGKADISADWADYLVTLNNMNMDRVLEVLNSAYQRQYQF